jgi:hypothetical protein
MGADRAVVEEEKAQRVTAQREDDERWRETLANDAALLAGARSSVEEYRQAIVRLGAEMVSLTDAIAAVDGEVPAAEQAHRDARAAADAVRSQVRAEMAGWWPEGKTDRYEGGEMLTPEQTFEAYLWDHGDVLEAESAASDAGQRVSGLSYKRRQLVRSLTTLAEHKAWLESELPDRQAWLEHCERNDCWNKVADVNRGLRRLTGPLKQPVEGAALRKARGEALVRKHFTEGK